MKVIAMKDQSFDQGKHVFKKGHYYSCYRHYRGSYIVRCNGNTHDDVRFVDTYFHELFKFENTCSKCHKVTLDDYPMEVCTECEIHECETLNKLMDLDTKED